MLLFLLLINFGNFVYLIFSFSFFLDQDDCTDVKWEAAYSQGEGLQVSGETVTVVSEGPYFIYSQVSPAQEGFVFLLPNS